MLPPNIAKRRESTASSNDNRKSNVFSQSFKGGHTSSGTKRVFRKQRSVEKEQESDSSGPEFQRTNDNLPSFPTTAEARTATKSSRLVSKSQAVDKDVLFRGRESRNNLRYSTDIKKSNYFLSNEEEAAVELTQHQQDKIHRILNSKMNDRAKFHLLTTMQRQINHSAQPQQSRHQLPKTLQPLGPEVQASLDMPLKKISPRFPKPSTEVTNSITLRLMEEA